MENQSKVAPPTLDELDKMQIGQTRDISNGDTCHACIQRVPNGWIVWREVWCKKMISHGGGFEPMPSYTSVTGVFVPLSDKEPMNTEQ